uniref:Uncharacterized protein n=1 Tax=Rhizophora mucronata TaxID=61149 RepID=A0A2P2N272_RHIMU
MPLNQSNQPNQTASTLEMTMRLATPSLQKELKLNNQSTTAKFPS